MSKNKSSSKKENDFTFENVSGAFRKLADILRNKEECNELREVAGQQCLVKAAYLNGNVSGKLSCLRSNKTYTFDFKPISYRKGFLLLAELQRLYFEYEERKVSGFNKKKGVFLKVKPEIECPVDRFNLDDSELIYLSKIVGCQDPFVKMILSCNQVENEAAIHIAVYMKG